MPFLHPILSKILLLYKIIDLFDTHHRFIKIKVYLKTNIWFKFSNNSFLIKECPFGNCSVISRSRCQPLNRIFYQTRVRAHPHSDHVPACLATRMELQIPSMNVVGRNYSSKLLKQAWNYFLQLLKSNFSV